MSTERTAKQTKRVREFKPRSHDGFTSGGYLDKPYELKSVAELDNLAANGDNAVILFYKTSCKWCLLTKPIIRDIAKRVHGTNNRPGSVPIVVAQIDGGKYKSDINKLRPGFFDGKTRGFPVILFKRGSDLKSEIWDQNEAPDLGGIASKMADIFGDDALRLGANDAETIATNQTGRYLFFINSHAPIMPRLMMDPNEPMISVELGSELLAAYLFANEHIAKDSLAIDVETLDRPDLPKLAVYDRKEQKMYPYRDALRWIRDQQTLDNPKSAAASTTPASGPASGNETAADTAPTNEESESSDVEGSDLEVPDLDATSDGEEDDDGKDE